jgi:hypothetical protein
VRGLFKVLSPSRTEKMLFGTVLCGRGPELEAPSHSTTTYSDKRLSLLSVTGSEAIFAGPHCIKKPPLYKRLTNEVRLQRRRAWSAGQSPAHTHESGPLSSQRRAGTSVSKEHTDIPILSRLRKPTILSPVRGSVTNNCGFRIRRSCLLDKSYQLQLQSP